MRIALRLLFSALLLYGGVCLAMYLWQRSLIYFPVPSAFASAGSTLMLPADGANLTVSVRPRAGSKALIYFGGNAEDVSASLPWLAGAFPDYAIYALHYRGYGGSSGKPSEPALHADALVLFDKVRLDHPNIAVVGRSLGSGVAVRLASRRPAARLVLVTPYDSFEKIAAAQFPYFPVRWLLTDKFDSARLAPAIRIPTLLLQAELDEVIPAASTDRLTAAFAPGVASRVIIRGATHNTISEFRQYADAMRAALER